MASYNHQINRTYNCGPDTVNMNNTKWTFMDIQHLLEISKNSLPENDQFKYSTAIEFLDWDGLKFNSFNASECREKLLEVIQMARQHRTLTELINEVEKLFKFQDKSSVQSETLTVKETVKQLPEKENNSEEDSTVIHAEIPAGNTETHADSSNDLTVRNTSVIEASQKENAPNEGTEAGTTVTENVMKQLTNWRQVVVNCGEKICMLQKDVTVQRRSKRIRKEVSRNVVTEVGTENRKELQSDTSKKPPQKASAKKIIAKKSVNNAALKKCHTKRPVNSFLRFYLEIKDNLKEKHPEMSVVQLASQAGKEYRNLPAARRQAYQKAYADQKKRNLQNMQQESCGTSKDEIRKPPAPKKNSSAANNVSDLRNLSTNRVMSANGKRKREDGLNRSANRKKVNQNNSSMNEDNNSECKNNDADGVDVHVGDREYWGCLLFANEKLKKLIHTKSEDKMKVLTGLWQSLEQEEQEVYIKKALRLSYEGRYKMEHILVSQVG